MQGKTFLFMVFSGLCVLPACFPRSHVLIEEGITWAEAQSHCREKYSDLASVHSIKELNKVAAVTDTHHVWIGLYSDINSWRWSLEKDGYYGEGGAEFRKWLAGRPNNYKGNENCVEMDAEGLWNDLPCKATRPFACYNGDEQTASSSSFVFVNEWKTWKEAQSYCRQHYTDLASVRNQAENEQIRNIIPQKTWIGLYRDGWKWSDGSSLSFRNWHHDEPNGDISTPCALLHQGKWADDTCDRKLYFVCQIVSVPVRRQVVRLKITKKDSSVNLEDAAEAMLQQISQTLKDYNLGGHITLTWRKQPNGKIFTLDKPVTEIKEIICNQK